MSRDELLDRLWREAIAFPADAVERLQADHDPPGPVLRRLLAAGVSPQEIAALLEWAGYEAVLTALTLLEEAEPEDLNGLHEGL